jgi:hypothetical protein
VYELRVAVCRTAAPALRRLHWREIMACGGVGAALRLTEATGWRPAAVVPDGWADACDA